MGGGEITKKAKISDHVKQQIPLLHSKGFNDPQIAKVLNISTCTVGLYRRQHGLGRNGEKKYEDFPLNDFEFDALVGSLIGDGSLTMPLRALNAGGSFAQSHLQKEYFFNKYNLWKSILGKWKYYETKDKRTGKVYKKYTTFFKAHPMLTRLYNMLYEESRKSISVEYCNLLSPISIAYLFMDDGATQTICTNGFDNESRDNLKNKFREWGIECTIHTQGTLFFSKPEFSKLVDLIKPYIIPEMMYKLEYKHLNKKQLQQKEMNNQ